MRYLSLNKVFIIPIIILLFVTALLSSCNSNNVSNYLKKGINKTCNLKCDIEISENNLFITYYSMDTVGNKITEIKRCLIELLTSKEYIDSYNSSFNDVRIKAYYNDINTVKNHHYDSEYVVLAFDLVRQSDDFMLINGGMICNSNHSNEYLTDAYDDVAELRMINIYNFDNRLFEKFPHLKRLSANVKCSYFEGNETVSFYKMIDSDNKYSKEDILIHLPESCTFDIEDNLGVVH